MYVYALNLQKNSKAGFEYCAKSSLAEAKSRMENEYRVTFSKHTKLDKALIISDIIAQASLN
ncbi:MAG: hypothetical protein SO164_07670 [Campylobacter sp.]|nr:hypothetical protein [Campylobacter sp.]